MSKGNGGNSKKGVLAIVGAVVLLGGVASGILLMEDRYAKKVNAASKKDLQSTHNVAQQALFQANYIQIDFIINSKQKRLWELQDRHGCPPRPDCPQSVKEEMRKLEMELQSLRTKKAAMDRESARRAAGAVP